ncbi:sodium/panthothenate symporter, partial [Virgibacillus halodenitrificans]|nr:sodium/panthothenate symporter [Virgibacillus halodenitrificans]
MNWQALVPLIGILLIIFAVGVWAGKSLRSSTSFLQDYFLGGRSMGGFLLAMTMTATYGSASSF